MCNFYLRTLDPVYELKPQTPRFFIPKLEAIMDRSRYSMSLAAPQLFKALMRGCRKNGLVDLGEKLYGLFRLSKPYSNGFTADLFGMTL